jgi:tetratricopeptide (TPR) repeat protein
VYSEAQEGDEVGTVTDELRADGEVDEALRRYREMSGKPLEALARGVLVDLLCGLGRTAEAETVCREGIAAGDRGSQRRLVALLCAQNRTGDAVAVLRELIAGRGTVAEAADVGLRSELGDLLAGWGRPVEAAAAYRDAIVLDGESSAADRWRGAGHRFGVAVELVSAYRDAIAAGHYNFAEDLVQELLDVGKLDQALVAYRDAPYDLGRGVPAELAGQLVEQGRLDEAIEVLQAADFGEDVALSLAGLLVSVGRYADAVVQYLWCDPDEVAAQIDRHPNRDALLEWWRQADEGPAPTTDPHLLDTIQARLNRPDDCDAPWPGE